MNTENQNITVIKPSSGWKAIDWQELWRYKDLLYFLTIRGIKAIYAQSVMGVSWAIIQPLATTIIFTVVFGNIAKIESNGIPYALFSFAAMVPWTYFQNTLTGASNSLITNKNMISKVYFPRMVLPLSTIFSKLIDFSIGIIVLIGFMIYYKTWGGIMLLWTPLMVFLLVLTSLGIGMFMSALAIQYRDIQYAMSFIVRMLMYAAPVVYPASKIPEKFIFWYSLNPMVGVIEGFRTAIVGHQEMPWELIWPGAIVAIITFWIGALYFRKMEKGFADVA